MGPIGNYWNAPSFVPVARWIGGELLAIRGWRLARWKEDGQLRLQSMTREEVWHGPVFTADYLPTASVGCGSGVYALKPSHRPHTLYEAPDQADYDWLSGRHAWIWGWVSLVGQVVEHEAGYRAQRAVVRRLHLGVCAHLALGQPEELAEAVRELEDRYQCPVKPGYWETRKAFRIQWSWRKSPRVPPQIPWAPPELRAPMPPPAWTPPVYTPQPPRVVRPLEKVVSAFQRAERELGSNWPIKGVGHCPRATIYHKYRRAVCAGTKCWQRVCPQLSWRHLELFPMAVVKRAARILRLKVRDLIGREW